MSVVVTNLTKTYGSQRAVNDVSFSVEAGQVVGFLGPNGAGKSTTMKMATCYLPPTAGSITVQGFDTVKQPTEVRRRVGYLAEHNPLYVDMYVREYLAFAGSLYGLRGSQLARRVGQMLELVGLGREQHKKIGALSKGYRQRVGLAQALLHDPPVLILDEPTTGLDPNQIVEIRQVIKTIGREKTVIFSTHIMQEVEALCDRVVIINLGQVVADSAVRDLRALQQTRQVVTVEFSAPIDADLLRQHPNVATLKDLGQNRYEITAATARDIRADLFQLTSERGWMLLGLQQRENNLEAIFQELTKN